MVSCNAHVCATRVGPPRSWTREHIKMCEKGILSRSSNQGYMATSLKRQTKEANEGDKQRKENERKRMKGRQMKEGGE